MFLQKDRKKLEALEKILSNTIIRKQQHSQMLLCYFSMKCCRREQVSKL